MKIMLNYVNFLEIFQRDSNNKLDFGGNQDVDPTIFKNYILEF